MGIKQLKEIAYKLEDAFKDDPYLFNPGWVNTTFGLNYEAIVKKVLELNDNSGTTSR